MRFFGKRPRATEAPAWVEILARGMGLILKKQDAQMGQIENFNSALSQLRAQFDALRDDVKANQTPKEPDLSSQISQLQDMANEAACDPRDVGRRCDAEQCPDRAGIYRWHDHQRRWLACRLINQRAGLRLRPFFQRSFALSAVLTYHDNLDMLAIAWRLDANGVASVVNRGSREAGICRLHDLLHGRKLSRRNLFLSHFPSSFRAAWPSSLV
jgi:hypothetical protein